VGSSLSFGAEYFHRNNKNQIGRESTTRLPGDYTAITSLNGAALTNPLTSQPLTLYNLSSAKATQPNYYQVTNVSQLDRYAYNAVELTATKHMSKRWMLLAV